MVYLTQAYHNSPEPQYLQDLKSLIGLEEWVSETKYRVLSWLSKLDSLEDKELLTHVINNSLFYEDYDKYSTMDPGGTSVGEGWNGTYRIYDNKGSYVTVNFDCYCQPGFLREHLKLFFTLPKDRERYYIVLVDVRSEQSDYNYENLNSLRSFLEWDRVSLSNLFCFLVNTMGKLFQFYQNNRFEILFSSDEFTTFWAKMEENKDVLKITN